MELNANASAVPSTRGGGGHGHLGTLISATAYAELDATIPWVNPEHPGATPVIPPTATGPQITEINRQFKANLNEYMVYKSCEGTLRKLIVQAVPDAFLNDKKHKLFGYANVTPKVLLDHLLEAYGTITADDLQANDDRLNAPWSPTQPIEDLWAQIKDCMDFAEGHDAISDKMAVRAVIKNLENSGVFTDALNDWYKKDDANQTFANLKKDFNKADKKRNKDTTAKHGYANAATKENVAPGPKSNGGMYYCWSHGLSNNPNHTSATCEHPANGHNKAATLFNMLGGNNRIRRQKDERPIFKPKPMVQQPRTETP